MTLPNFIVIGAAKAGTTALYWYLSEHPGVFMSPVKETNFFAYGRDAQGNLLYGDPAVHHFPIQTMVEYQELFARAGTAAAIGEASPIYLECPQAADRIRAAIPSVRIIASSATARGARLLRLSDAPPPSRTSAWIRSGTSAPPLPGRPPIRGGWK